MLNNFKYYFCTKSIFETVFLWWIWLAQYFTFKIVNRYLVRLKNVFFNKMIEVKIIVMTSNVKLQITGYSKKKKS